MNTPVPTIDELREDPGRLDALRSDQIPLLISQSLARHMELATRRGKLDDELAAIESIKLALEARYWSRLHGVGSLKYVTVKQLAEKTTFSTGQLYEEIRTKKLRALETRKHPNARPSYKVSVDDFNQWAMEHKNGA